MAPTPANSATPESGEPGGTDTTTGSGATKPAPGSTAKPAAKRTAANSAAAAGAKTTAGASVTKRTPKTGAASTAPAATKSGATAKAGAARKAAATTPAPALPADERAALDAAIGDLAGGSHVWAALTVSQRARLVRSIRRSIGTVAQEWVDIACASKGLAPGHVLSGEEWLGGPYAVITLLDALASSLDAIATGASPLDGVTVAPAPGGRIRVKSFPANGRDKLLLSGFTGEVWLEPGVTAAEARNTAGLAQLTPGDNGGVGLVLGAGNVTSIPVSDVLYELFAHNRVALLKVNPTQDALVPVFERALAPLIEPGFLRIVRGGPAAGAYLTGHSGLAHVHITGSAATFDAIVWGTGAEGAANRAADAPQLQVPITAELGGVSPIIVVPGVWTDADLKYQAEHVATMRLVNSGHNCIAGQVVIVSADWPQREQFLRELHSVYATAPRRPVWYPRSDERLGAVAEAYPDAVWSADRTRAIVSVGSGTGTGTGTGTSDPVESIEYFAPVLGIVEVPGTGQEFLDAAVAHANDKLTGTLGANVLIDPVTESALGDGFERAIADLRYGAVAINTWTAFVFLSATLTWGGFPGATTADVSSGIGVVHNALLLDRVERSIGRGPFRPFPRAFGRGVFTVLPTPPWFVTARTGAEVCAGLTRYLIDGSLPGLVSTFAKAMRA
ncbi:acyl-CoA reductase-like NAD-dependent aldehyde dehydrogenase [Microbacterium terrae]|uniref:NAD/NADP-dependent betaine aldehyde dehydrogenase n=1 Tax=Microbacterium terrae TaxID=69369 RepID=A0A0M2HDB2_9MICO|nr:aldehyde dehydrogenase family protein [Microbacterium terrae]KJL42689.1 NAD/NADP-dependent betaine aldehyde dehydrogenase [Microbacterium terrae]MBP1078598.1 acyl-CoA reductase-like NAD-dependent aldehyde dehydrogenase [Microbacterium terrae]